MSAIFEDITTAVGYTPLVKINKLGSGKAVILVKLESKNPCGSVKDRIALSMIEAAEEQGKITKDTTIIEPTSGNTGIGLALVCSIKGYKLLLTMSEAVSVERQKILKARGAEILLTPGHLGTDGAIEEVYHLARENPETYFMADQFNNQANWEAHYFTTAEEIWKHLPADSEREESVHMTGFPRVNEAYLDDDLADKWERILQVRDQVSKALEEARTGKVVGHPLDAKVGIEASPDMVTLLESLSEELKAVFIVSQVSLRKNPSIKGVEVKVEKAGGGKCERCWNYDVYVGKDKSHPSLCKRCLAAIGTT